mgnify:CR=1 FL=1
MNFILASNSPRRKELLAGLGVEFTIKTIDGIDESYPDSLRGEQIPLHIANKKADAYVNIIQDDEILITADTLVYIDIEGKEIVLGKPNDKQQAVDMIKLLAGKTHQVTTAVCLITKQKRKVFAVTTNVTFDNLTNEEIDFYVDNYKPYDKAGAYGIQEWIGFIGVNRIEGSYFNVMGLPVQRLYQELKKWNVI